MRNQAMIKLYVIFNMLEIFDKLCTSFGQVRARVRVRLGLGLGLGLR